MKYKFILALILISLLTSAATIQDCRDIQGVVQKECKKINKSCKIYIDTQNNNINAYTNEGYKIIFSIEMVRQFSRGELLAVALHEVGHIMNGDVETIIRLGKDNPDKLTDKNIRHSMEYNADSYATKYLGYRCAPNYMVDVLYKVRKDLYKESNTHPSPHNRILNSSYIYKNRCSIR